MMKKISVKKSFTTIYHTLSISVTLLGIVPMISRRLSIRDRLQLTIFQLNNLVPFWYPLIYLVSKFFRRPWSRNPTNLHPHSWKWWNRSYLHCSRLAQSWSGLVQRWKSFRGETRNFRPSGQQAFHYSDWYQRANLRCLQMQSH